MQLNVQAFLESDFAARIRLVNQVRGTRLWSPQLASIWAEVFDGLHAAGERSSPRAGQIARELMALAPDSELAKNAYQIWLENADRAAASSSSPIVYLILSCEKFAARATALHDKVLAHLQPCYILIGAPGIAEAQFEGRFLRVPAPDNYESLTVKILEGLVAIRRLCGRVGVLKIDDDAEFRALPDTRQIAELAATTQYAGLVVGADDFDRCWHVGKCEVHADEPYRRRFRGSWAGGRLYYLGPHAVDLLVREYLFYADEFAEQIFEDKAIGDALGAQGIMPTHLDLSSVFGITVAIDQPPTRAPLALAWESADQRRAYWDHFFSRGEDPWQYENLYESTKYQQALALLPQHKLGKALELACAEGHFTVWLASRVDHLIATDISAIALERARVRCNGLANVQWQVLDFVADALPGDLDLMVCSEALYYVPLEQLPLLVEKFHRAIKPGGYLLMAHAAMIADDRTRTGFDWGHAFGVAKISEVFAARVEFVLMKELRTPLYRVQLFQRMASAGAAAPDPVIAEASHALPLPVLVERSVIWDGAVCTRAEAQQRETTRDVPILMYHSIADEGPAELSPYRVSVQNFQAQMRFLRRHGYHSLSLEEWVCCIRKRTEVRGCPVVITFDDGYKNFITHAAPILEASDFRATVFTVTGKVGGRADWDPEVGAPLALMDWEDLRCLESRGFAIGSHTSCHRDLCTLSDDAIVQDGDEARRMLLRELGHEVVSVAFPWGRNDARVRAALARAGYRIGLGTTGGRSSLDDDPICLPRIEIFGQDDIDVFSRRLEIRASKSSGRVAKPQIRPSPGRPDVNPVPDQSARAEPGMTASYMRLLAARVGRLIDSLMALQSDLLTAVAPAEHVQRRLALLFTIPITGDSERPVQPYDTLVAGICFGFEAGAALTMAVRPKHSYSISPDTCLNSLHLAFSGATRWRTLEASISWAEFAGARRYQLNFCAEPDRRVRCHVVLRLPLLEQTHLDHTFASFELAPDRRFSVTSGDLNLPELGGVDTGRTALLIFFFEPEPDLRLRLDYINIYFG